MDNQSAIEWNQALLRLLHLNWNDSQSASEWNRIHFQLNGAALASEGELAQELDFLSSVALERQQMLEYPRAANDSQD